MGRLSSEALYCLVVLFHQRIAFSLQMQFKENAVLLTRLPLVISNILWEDILWNRPKNSCINLNLIDCIPPFPCISTDEHKMHSLVLVQTGKDASLFFVTELNNPFKNKKKSLIHISSTSSSGTDFPSFLTLFSWFPIFLAVHCLLTLLLPAQSPISLWEKAYQLSFIFHLLLDPMSKLTFCCCAVN